MRRSWPNKIRQLRSTLQLSQDGLARRLHVTKKTVAEWEQARQPPSPARALELARLIEPGGLRRWFIEFALQRIGADTPMVLDALRPALSGPPVTQGPLRSPELRIVTTADAEERFRALEGLDHYVPLPVLSDAAAAGAPATISDDDVDGYALIQYAWCPNPENFTCVRVRGDSMTPILHDGALVAVDHSQRDPRRLRNKMVAARVEDGVTIKWLENTPAGGLRLAAENKDYPALELPRTHENPVIGLVAWWWNRPK